MSPPAPLQMEQTPLYLAGPMSGIKAFNFPLFDEVAATLRARGYTIVSPAELDDPETRAAALASQNGKVIQCGKTWGDSLSRDLKVIVDEVRGIVLLPGWEKSSGARLEAFLGVTLKYPIFEYFATGPIVLAPIEHEDIAAILRYITISGVY